MEQPHTRSPLLRPVTALALGTLMLATACARQPDHAAESVAVADAAAPAAAGGPTTVNGNVPLMTGWALTVEMLPAGIPTMVTQHASRCIEAGPALCRVLIAEANSTGDEASGQLQVLAEPNWLLRFRQGVEADIQTKGGKAVAESVSMQNVAGELQAANDAVRDTQAGTDQRRDAVRNQGNIEDRIALQAMSVRYQATPALLSGEGGAAIKAVLSGGGTLAGYGLALALALAMLAAPVLGLVAGVRWLRRGRAVKVAAA